MLPFVHRVPSRPPSFHRARRFVVSRFISVPPLSISGYGRSFFISYRSPAYLPASAAASAEISTIRNRDSPPRVRLISVDVFLFALRAARSRLGLQLPRLRVSESFIIVLSRLALGIFIPDRDRFFLRDDERSN